MGNMRDEGRGGEGRGDGGQGIGGAKAEAISVVWGTAV